MPLLAFRKDSKVGGALTGGAANCKSILGILHQPRPDQSMSLGPVIARRSFAV
jgi:hypothetical protein